MWLSLDELSLFQSSNVNIYRSFSAGAFSFRKIYNTDVLCLLSSNVMLCYG